MSLSCAAKKRFERAVFEILMLAIVACVLVGSSNAASYDKWVLASSSITMGKYIVIPSIDPTWEMASISVSNDSVLLGKGECESGLSYRVCFLGTRFNLTLKQGRLDAAYDRMIPEMRITLEEIVPQLTFSQKSEKAQVYAGEENTVRITIYIPPTTPLRDVSFRQEIPDYVTITNLGEFEIEEGMLTWDWPLLSGEKNLVYRMEFNRAANMSITSNLSGVYATGAKVSKSSKLTIKGLPDPNPINMTASFSETQPELGDSVTYTLTLANSESRPNNVGAILIFMPGSVSVTRWDNSLTQIGSRLSWGGDIPGKGQEQFSITFRPERTGKHNITAKLDNTYYSVLQSKNIISTKNLISKLDVKFKPLAPKITFMLNRKQVNASEQSSIHVFVHNPNNKTALYDVEGFLVTDILGNHTNRIERLLPGEQVELFYIRFIAPSFAKDTKLNAALNGTYKTQFNEELGFKASNSLLIKKDLNPPVNKSINVTAQNQTGSNQTGTGAQNTSSASQGSSGGGKTEEESPQTGGKGENFFTRAISWFKGLFKGK